MGIFIGNSIHPSLPRAKQQKEASMHALSICYTRLMSMHPDTNELDALEFAMNSEMKAIDYYSEIKEKTKDENIRQIINEIIEQEKNHYSIFQEEFDYLGKTGYWYELDFLGG